MPLPRRQGIDGWIGGGCGGQQPAILREQAGQGHETGTIAGTPQKFTARGIRRGRRSEETIHNGFVSLI